MQLLCQALDALHHLPAAAANRARGPGSETLRVTPPQSPRDVASHPIEPKDMERTHSGASSYMSELEEESEGPKPAPKPKGAARTRAVILALDCLLAVTSTAINQLSGISGFHNSASLSVNAHSSSPLQALVPGVRTQPAAPLCGPPVPLCDTWSADSNLWAGHAVNNNPSMYPMPLAGSRSTGSLPAKRKGLDVPIAGMKSSPEDLLPKQDSTPEEIMKEYLVGENLKKPNVRVGGVKKGKAKKGFLKSWLG